MIYKLILGDWSEDGHGISRNILVDGNPFPLSPKHYTKIFLNLSYASSHASLSCGS